MWSQVVWGTCIALESFLLLRAVQTGLLKRFPVFYSYISLVLAVDLVAIPLFKMSPNIYLLFYWATAFLKAVLGYAVIVEIYNVSLKNYPGVARLVRVLLLIVFLAVAVKVGATLLGETRVALPFAIGGMERNLRQVQTALLFCLLALFLYYKIPLNRNGRGLLLGYSLFVGADVISLTFITHPATGFASLMRQIDPLCYALALLIWSAALWSPSPEPVFQGVQGIERDYGSLARQTRALLLQARTHLIKVARP